jgi:Domain of unknown function (DUF4345)
MTTLPGTVVLAASSLFALATSWDSFRTPRRFAERLGLVLPGADGLNEVRAQYGGFFLAVAASGGAALAGLIPREAGLIVAGTVFGGLILGRLVSLLLDGGVRHYGGTIRALFFIDAFGLAAVIAAVAAEAAR